jgi:hypothetical protein
MQFQPEKFEKETSPCNFKEIKEDWEGTIKVGEKDDTTTFEIRVTVIKAEKKDVREFESGNN